MKPDNEQSQPGLLTTPHHHSSQSYHFNTPFCSQPSCGSPFHIWSNPTPLFTMVYVALFCFYSVWSADLKEVQNADSHSRLTKSESMLQQHPPPPRGFLSLSKDTVASVTLPHDLALLWLHCLPDTHSFSVSTSVPLHLLCLLPDTNFQCVSTWLKCPNSFRILLNYQWASPDIKSQYCPKNLHSPRIPVLSALLLLQSPFQLSGILCLCLLICLLFLFCSTL